MTDMDKYLLTADEANTAYDLGLVFYTTRLPKSQNTYEREMAGKFNLLKAQLQKLVDMGWRPPVQVDGELREKGAAFFKVARQEGQLKKWADGLDDADEVISLITPAIQSQTRKEIGEYLKGHWAKNPLMHGDIQVDPMDLQNIINQLLEGKEVK